MIVNFETTFKGECKEMSRKLQDEFSMARLPLRPLPYELMDNSYTHELMVNSTGLNPNYHIYITDPEDPEKVYDLSAAIIKEGFNSKDLTISIDGVDEPIALKDIISYIYKRFVHINDVGGFRKDRDMPLVIDTNNRNILLQDINGGIVFPIVRADAIFDSEGKTLQDRFDSITHLAFIHDSILIDSDGQSIFEVIYPFKNYPYAGNYMELRIGGTVIASDRYAVNNNYDENNDIYGATISFPNETFEEGRRIDILYLYNASSASENAIIPMDGNQFANKSISTAKLARTSDSYTVDDSNCLPTSKAIFKLYQNILDSLAYAAKRAFFVKDMSDNNRYIIVNITNENIEFGINYTMLSVFVNSNKDEDLTLRVLYTKNGQTLTNEYQVMVPNGIGKGRLIRFLVTESNAEVYDITSIKLDRSRYIHYCLEDESTISFAEFDYERSSLINIYKNGIRLFEDVDYSIDFSRQVINLFVPSTLKDIIVFEATGLAF